MDALLALIAAGRGIGVGPHTARFTAPRTLRVIPLAGWQVGVVALTRTNHPDPAVDPFLTATQLA